jgi:adenylate cyclase
MMQQTQQTQKVVCWRHGQLPEYAKSLFALTGRIGLDAGDSDEIALRKRLAYSAPVRATYYSVECRIPRRWRAARGCHPGFYSVFTPINTIILARICNFRVYRFSQPSIILILPWLVTLSLGGFRQSGVVIIWAALCTIRALLLDELHRTLFWIIDLSFC